MSGEGDSVPEQQQQQEQQQQNDNPSSAATTTTAAAQEGDAAPPATTTTDGNEEHAQPGAEEEVIPEGAEVHKIPGDLYRNLVGMGYSENAVKKSIVSGCINEDTCLQWLQMHQGHAELDTPLDANVYCKIVEKKKLTPEELEAKVREMKEKIAKKKVEAAEDEARRDREREKNRVEGAKHAREAKEEREKKQRLEAYEEARKEKLRDIAAKERVQIQLAVDKKVRKGMDPEEARKEAIAEMEEKKKKLEEEKQKRLEEQQREREEALKRREAEAKAPASSGGGGGGGWNIASVLGDYQEGAGGGNNTTTAGGGVPAAAAPPSTVAPTPAPVPDLQFLLAASKDNYGKLLAQMMSKMSDAGQGEQFTATVKTLSTIVTNILQQPLEMKFRQLKKSTNVFSHKLAPAPHCVELLLTVGFRSEKLPPAAEGQAPVDAIVLRSVVIKRLVDLKEILGAYLQ